MFRVSIPVTCSQTLPKYINNLRIKIFLCLFGGMRMASPQTYIGHMYTHTQLQERLVIPIYHLEDPFLLSDF